jgi:hypothetical protein
MTGHYAVQTGRDLAYGDTSARALPATPCRPTPWGINLLDQQPYPTQNPRYMVSVMVTRGGQDATRGENDVNDSRPGETCPGSQRTDQALLGRL